MSVVDEEAFTFLCRIALEHRNASKEGVLAVTKEFVSALSHQRINLTQLYLIFLLHRRVWMLLQHEPTDAELRAIVGSVYERYKRVLISPLKSAEDTLLTVFDRLPDAERSKGGEFFARLAALFGLLLDDPDLELPVLHEHLANWCSKFGDDLEAVTRRSRESK